MAEKNLWTAFFIILSAILGIGAGQIDAVDDLVEVPFFEPESVNTIQVGCSSSLECPPSYILAYMCDGTKRYCEGIIGPDLECKTTEEILSSLG